MNPSEKVVNAWLHSKGYFTMTNIMLFQRQEIDILAVKPEGNKMRREHYEVHVSIKPAGAIRAKRSITTSKEPFEQQIKESIKSLSSEETERNVRKLSNYLAQMIMKWYTFAHAN